MIQKKKKVVVGMSGGVDSSVAAALLKEQGYDVIGVFMQFWFPEGAVYGENRCCSLESFQEALRVADILKIPLHKMNFGQPFKDSIVDSFLTGYGRGQTPNPCVACNKFIKFGLFLKKAKVVFNADYVATGHYVRLVNKKNRHAILRGADSNKDQSYFLYNLQQSQLKHVLFPLGDYEKPEVRRLAKKYKLPVHDKKDSQEVCFVGNSHQEFLQRYLHLKSGKITDEQGKEQGKHNGLPLYTMGQRTGIGLSGGPWYVCGFNRRKNILIVTKDEKKSDIYQKELVFHKANWVGERPKFPLTCEAQVRYRAKAARCVVKKSGTKLIVTFKEPQRAIMPGQSVVFYRGDELLGGGIIK